MHRCPSFLHGVPRAGSPTSSVLLRHSETPPFLPRHFVSFAQRYPIPIPIDNSLRVTGNDGGSKVPVDPFCVHALLSDPGEISVPGLNQHVDVAFRCCNGVGSHV